MKRHAIISAFLWLGFSDTSSANDPFSIIFGDRPVRVSVTNDASNDSVTILRLKIRHHLISKDWIAHELSDGLCIPVMPLADALEFPLFFKDNIFSGHILGQTQKVEINPEKEVGFIKTENGWCAFEEQLETIFPVGINFNSSNLELVISPNLTLPIDERLAREEIRKSIEDEKKTPMAQYRPVENPYRMFSLPTLDFGFDASSSASSSQNLAANISAAADFLWMNAHFQSSSTLENAFETNRLRLFRSNSQAEELSILKARRFAIGDISSLSQSLISRSQSGRGFSISNQPLFKPELFDETILRGHLPEGWEAELFDGEVLLAFKTEPDQNGEYVFENVPLRPGYNHLVIKLFGPHGESSQRQITQFVGSEHCPEDEWRYSFGTIDPERSFLGETLLEFNEEEKIATTNKPSAFLSLEHGLSKDMTLRGDLNVTEEKTLFSASLINSLFNGYGVGRIAMDEAGLLAWELNYQKRLSSSTSLSTKYSDFGKLQTSVNGISENRLLKQISGRLDTRLKIAGSITPAQAEVSINKRANNTSELIANFRLAGNIKQSKWSNSLRFSSMSQAGSRNQSLQGELLGSYTFSDVRLRGAINYSLIDTPALNSLSLSARKKINRSSQVQTSVTYNMRNKTAALDGSISKSFKTISIQTKAKIDNTGDWALGLGLSFSIFYDERQGRYKSAKPGLSRTGVIAPRVFDDLNNNGVFDLGDNPIKGAQFIVENSLRSEESDTSGTNVIADLSPSKLMNTEIKLSSIEDPFLRPLEVGRTVELRAGQVLAYDVPLIASGEIEGVLKVVSESRNTPVAGIKLQAFNSLGQIVGQTQTEYDGYFYLEDVPATALILKVSQTDLELIGGTFEPIKVSLSRKFPSHLGLSLTLEQD